MSDQNYIALTTFDAGLPGGRLVKKGMRLTSLPPTKAESLERRGLIALVADAEVEKEAKPPDDDTEVTKEAKAPSTEKTKARSKRRTKE